MKNRGLGQKPLFTGVVNPAAEVRRLIQHYGLESILTKGKAVVGIDKNFSIFFDADSLKPISTASLSSRQIASLVERHGPENPMTSDSLAVAAESLGFRVREPKAKSGVAS